MSPVIDFGAPGETRTPTPVKKTDFESVASTSSATGAIVEDNTYKYKVQYVKFKFFCCSFACLLLRDVANRFRL